MSKLKILLNFSNQTHNVDTNGVTEQKNAKELAQLTKQKLDTSNYSDGIEVCITPADNSDNLQAVVNFEHNYKPNLFVSFHFNGSNDKTVSGSEAWYAIGDAKGQQLASKISADIAKVLNIPDRKAKITANAPQGGITVVDYTNATAILIETCFQSNSNDVKVYNANKIPVANAIAWAILDSLIRNNGLKQNAIIPPAKPTKDDLLKQVEVLKTMITKL